MKIKLNKFSFMRTLIFLIFILLHINCLSAFSQKLPRGSNIIIVEMPDSANKALKEFAILLQDKGYSIEKFDKELLSITTDFKNYETSTVAKMKIFVVAKQDSSQSILKIRGKIEVSGLYGQVPYDACFCGMVGDARKDAFYVLYDIVALLKSKKVDYIKE